MLQVKPGPAANNLWRGFFLTMVSFRHDCNQKIPANPKLICSQYEHINQTGHSMLSLW